MTYNNRIRPNIFDRIIVNKESVNIIDSTINEYLDAPIEVIEAIAKTETALQNEGIFIIEELEKALHNSGFYFQIGTDSVTIAELEGDVMTFKAVLDIGYNASIKSFIIYKKSYKLKNEGAQEILKESARRTANLVFNFFRYTQLVNYLKQDSKVIIKRSSINKPKGKTKKELQREAREQARKRVSVSSDVKTYDYSNAEREGEKRKYERKTEQWSSRGHWRTSKLGKRFWCKGSIKGDKSGKFAGKDFTV